MEWSDVEYFLQKVYLQNRSNYSSLINRENGLNLSCTGSLSKTSPDCLKTQRKIVQIVNEVYENACNENEKLIVSDMSEHYKDELVLMLAKDLKYPAVLGIKNTLENSNFHAADLLMKNLIDQFSNNFNSLIDLNSVQSTVDLADSALAAIHNNFKGNNNNNNNNNYYYNNRDDDIICLTQSINNTILNSKNNGLDENISIVNNDIQMHESNPFMTAKQALARNINNKQLGHSSNSGNTGNSNASYNSSMQARKLLGAKRRFVDPKSNGGNESGNYRDEGRDINTEFSYYNMNKAPVAPNNAANHNNATNHYNNNNKALQKPQAQGNGNSTKDSNPDEPIDERLAGIEPRIIEMIRNEIMHRVDNITWESIAGLEHAKNSIKEIVVWPMLRPDIFKGLRGPPKGLLLFGPPGTGKTMIGKCIASQAKATFFSISASSLTSKWVGEGEKMVRALFAVARCSQPAVIFIDEIDSLLTQRTDGEFEASRRIKTEFLVQFDGAGTNSEDRILVIGATNRPQEIDEAARRRLLKRLYIPLPESEARATIIKNLLSNQSHSLTEEDINWICSCTDGYSGSDMDGLCREAAIGPIRSISDILNISTSDVRPISRQDFEEALSQVRASVSNQDLELYLDWNKKFGSLNIVKG